MVNKFPTSLQARMAQSGGPLGRIIGIAGRQLSLTARVRELLPAPLNQHCAAVDQEKDTLRLVMDSPAWAARVRYLLPTLRSRLCQLVNPPASRVDVRAGRPAETAPEQRPRKPRTATELSQASRRHITETARYLSDPDLRRALERLARDDE